MAFNNEIMIASDYSQLAETALAMAEADRAELVALLLRSFNEQLPVGQRRSTEEWVAEISRRSDELHQGNSPLVDAEDALATIRARSTHDPQFLQCTSEYP